ncbi:DNA translocase FtsK [candidate division KSB1 bacterium]|nr:DNA translocase FtsK [candidate division KSB1 bacterium]
MLKKNVRANKKKQKQQDKPVTIHNRQEELLGILLLVFGVLVFIALFTYDPEELPETVELGYVHNGLGIAGVYIAHYLIRWTIGFPIFFLPFIIISWGINRLLGKDSAMLLRVTIMTFIFSYYVSISFALHDAISSTGGNPAFRFSGWLGGLGARFLLIVFGQYGSVVIFIGVVLLSVLLSTTISIRDIYDAVSSVILRVSLFLSRLFGKIRFPSVKKAKSPFERKSGFREPVVHGKMPEIGFRDTGPVPAGPRIRQQVEASYDIEEPAPKSSAEKERRRPLSTGAHQMEFNLGMGFTDDDEIIVDPAVDTQKPYEFPPLNLLEKPQPQKEKLSEVELRNLAHHLERTLSDYGVKAVAREIYPGPVITRFELELSPGTKVSRITSLADDLAMAMRAKRIRIVAPIPGKAAVGVEIPNPHPQIVYLAEILSTPDFEKAKSPLTIGFGKTISGAPYITDLATMPHLLVAGSTGSGKSVCLNTIITSFLYKSHPSEVQLVMIDPKRLELSTYKRLFRHHLAYVDNLKEKVATSAKSAVVVLRSVEVAMEQRYEILALAGVRNIEEYNERVKQGLIKGDDGTSPPLLPYLVLVVDELADLMLTASAAKEVEEPIARLTQMSRAVGIHLILATQRPSVDVITGVIKANFPARIAFQVASKIDSRTILDMNGAEKLLGRGDMLFLPPGSPEPIRLHNAFIRLEEIEKVLAFIAQQAPIQKQNLPMPESEDDDSGYGGGMGGGKRDPLFKEALKLVVRHQQGSVSLLQRRLNVGYSRAARMIDQLEDAGYVGPFEGSKAREVLVSSEELEAMIRTEEDDS